MAEALFNYWHSRKTSFTIETSSAGIAALEGLPATAETKKALEEKGLSVDHHGSRPVTHELVEESDLIVVMTASQREALFNRYPGARGKTRLLKQVVCSPQEEAAAGMDVADPLGGDLEIYRQTLQEIEKYVKKLVGNLEAIIPDLKNGGESS